MFNFFGNKENKITTNKSKLELFQGPALRKFMTLFAAGVLSMSSLEAAELPMTMEQKDEAKEYMEKSKQNIKNYESKLLEYAKSEAIDHSYGDTTEKVFNLTDATAALIKYVDGKPIAIYVREIGENNTKIRLGDNSLNGIVDHVITEDSKGNKSKHNFKEAFKEGTENDVDHVSVSGLESNFMQGVDLGTQSLVSAQKAFEEVLSSVDTKLSENQLAQNQ